MILQSLVKYYELLAQARKVAPYGWSPQKVSYALCIDDNGEVTNVIDLREIVTKGKSTKKVPTVEILPYRDGRTSGVKAYFLCDKAEYILGAKQEKVENEEDEKKAKLKQLECFEASKKKHCEFLKNSRHPAAKALIAYYNKWECSNALQFFEQHGFTSDILKDGNIVFRYKSTYLHEIEEIRKVWDITFSEYEGLQGYCLATGKYGILEDKHPKLSFGKDDTLLVSFNKNAYESYGKKGGMNAPTDKYAAYAYGEALKYLKNNYELKIGSTSVFCWSETAEPEYQNIFNGLLNVNSKYSEYDYRQMLSDITKGHPVVFEEKRVDPECPFYVMGVVPNKARLSVRFFYRDTFGKFLSNIYEHQKRMEIVKDNQKCFYVWNLVSETLNHKEKNPEPKPSLPAELLLSILNNSYYPATLINGVNLRIRAEHDITSGKAAIIKAYYLKNQNKDIPKEVLTVALNKECKDIPYNLGRLFAVLEFIQEKANPGLNATIKDKYFNSASSTPAIIFPILIDLAQKHLRKMSMGLRVYYEKQVEEIISNFNESYPARLNLAQQGSFQIGYYHQKQDRFQSKN